MWKVVLLGCSKKRWLNNNKDCCDDDDLMEAELSITNNKSAASSYGWADENKIVFTDELNPGTKEQRRLIYRRAEICCEALNQKEYPNATT